MIDNIPASPDNSWNEIAKQVLLQAIQAVKDGADWLKGQIPDILQELIRWKLFYTISTEIMYILIGIATIIVYLKVGKKIKIYCKDEDDKFPVVAFYVFGGVISGGIVIGMLTAFCNNISPLMELIFAPKIYLLEYAAHLMGNKSLDF